MTELELKLDVEELEERIAPASVVQLFAILSNAAAADASVTNTQLASASSGGFFSALNTNLAVNAADNDATAVAIAV